MKTTIRVVEVIFLVGILISCPLLEGDWSASPPEIEDPASPDDGLGALEIDFTVGFKNAKTLSPPPGDLEIKRYEIAGELNGGDETFSGSVNPDGKFTQYGLIVGVWTITVSAYNAETGGVIIVEGTAEASIAAGSTTSIQIILTPPGGSGILELTVQWDKNLLDKKALVATLLPVITAFEPEGELPFIVKNEPIGDYWVGTFTSGEIPAGYYTLSLQLFDGSQPVWGITEAVRILQNLTTSQTYSYP